MCVLGSNLLFKTVASTGCLIIVTAAFIDTANRKSLTVSVLMNVIEIGIAIVVRESVCGGCKKKRNWLIATILLVWQ